MVAGANGSGDDRARNHHQKITVNEFFSEPIWEGTATATPVMSQLVDVPVEVNSDLIASNITHQIDNQRDDHMAPPGLTRSLIQVSARRNLTIKG